jgi:kumamolisin
MAFQERIHLAGSDRKAPAGAQTLGPTDPNLIVRVTVVLRRQGADPSVGSGKEKRTYLTREQLTKEHGANPADIARLEKFAHQYNLAVAETSLQKRRVVLTGTAKNMQTAFGTSLTNYREETSGLEYHGRQGLLSIPADLQSSILAVLGMDNRPVAKPHFRVRAATGSTAGTFTPPQVAQLYNYPSGATGSGQTIAIIELGGGYSTTDLTTYFQNLGITEPNVTAVSVDGGANTPGSDADGEVMLDIEVAGSIAPGANIAVYFAPNTDQGFIDAITDAVHDTTRTPSVVSISWGGPEDSWTTQSQTAMNAALQDAASLGVTVTVAAGDGGSSDGDTDGKLHVDFPASSPYALACGGTTLQGSGNTITSEVVWNETANQEGATGGGVSIVFPLPSYQNSAGVPTQGQTGYAGRGVPDVAGNADPTTGYQVIVDGQNQIVGGTSAVAPLWAALIALINQQAGKPVGFINPTLYPTMEEGFHDITSGNNDDSNLGFYSAGPGWDACSGLGSPDGTAILQLLTSTASSAAASGKRSRRT